MIKIYEIHTAKEIATEVERLRRKELPTLIKKGIVNPIHPAVMEDNLRVEAYSRLTERKIKSMRS